MLHLDQFLSTWSSRGLEKNRDPGNEVAIVWVSPSQRYTKDNVSRLRNNKKTFDTRLIRTQTFYFNHALYKSFIAAIMRHICQFMIVNNIRSTQKDYMLRTIYNVGVQYS